MVYEFKCFTFEATETIEPVKNPVSSFAILLIIFITTSCNNETDEISSANHLSIKQHKHSQGELVSGPEPPQIQIDFPTCSFAPDSGKLYGIINFNIDNNFEVICTVKPV